MNRNSFFIFIIILLISVFAFFHFVQAHEVYVLNQDEINFAMNSSAPDFIQTIKDHLTEFLTWGMLVMSIIVLIFFLSINNFLERSVDPFLNTLKIYAPFIAQITLGSAMFASGYYHAVFGVELPVSALVGDYGNYLNIISMVSGIMLLIGFLPRAASFIVLSIFIALCAKFGIYMLNYATYAGEALTILLLGGAYHVYSSQYMKKIFSPSLENHLHKYKFLIMRIFFGISLVYASLYAKLIHGSLALETVSKYHLTNYFPFDPVFLVLGAMILEILLGLCFILGFEIRFASIFFLIFLTLSLLFFGEAVWPHLILIGTAISMFMHGYDKYCLSANLFQSKKKNLEPIL